MQKFYTVDIKKSSVKIRLTHKTTEATITMMAMGVHINAISCIANNFKYAFSIINQRKKSIGEILFLFLFLHFVSNK